MVGLSVSPWSGMALKQLTQRAGLGLHRFFRPLANRAKPLNHPHSFGTRLLAKRGNPEPLIVCLECGHRFRGERGKCPSCKATKDSHTVEYEDDEEVSDEDGEAGRPQARESGGIGQMIAKRYTSKMYRKKQQSRAGDGESTSPPHRAWIQDKAKPRSVKQVLQEIGDPNHEKLHLGSTELGSQIGRVLGGGVVKGSLTLVGGDPGVGKSTLLLQVGGILAEKGESVMYISAEESLAQVAARADRLGYANAENLHLANMSEISGILAAVCVDCPATVAIIDSMQTVYADGNFSSTGTESQIRDCATAAMHVAQGGDIAFFFVGHSTKEDRFAGPQKFQHMVDATLYLEGEEHSTTRILRSHKNRFGPDKEAAFLDMSQEGLAPLRNARMLYVGSQTPKEHDKDGFGYAVAAKLDGSTGLLVEVQALCEPVALPVDSSDSDDKGARPGTWGQQNIGQIRESVGISSRRRNIIMAVLRRHVLPKASRASVALHLQVACGERVAETEASTDLAILVAIVGAMTDTRIPRDMVFLGHLDLSGALRQVNGLATLVEEAARECSRVVVPKGFEAPNSLEGLGVELIEASSAEDAVYKVLGAVSIPRKYFPWRSGKGKEAIEATDSKAEPAADTIA